MKNREFLDDYFNKIRTAYTSKRPKSKSLYEAAQQYLPGGDTRTVTYYRPYPAFMHHGKGCMLYDVDGSSYVDFVNNYTSLVHGHAHPKVVDAVTEQVRLGSVFASPVENQIRLGQIICDRLPSADKVRFCNSGTEATMAAIRLARAYTKKYKIIKMEGGYHGSHDLAEISIKPAIEKAGPIESPHSVPEDMGIPPNVIKDCVIAPFNQSETVARILTQNKEDLAAVIVEPLQMACGAIPPTLEFLETIRELTSKYKIPLIFDEVVSLRLARGGCQDIYNIMPDITALGKIIGGGYPVGAVAGREEFMDLFSPLNDNSLFHSGTFNGNPITMAAGVASMNALTASEIERINELGNNLRARFSSILEEVGIIAQVTGMGSLGQIHFTGQQVSDWRGAATGRIDIRSILHLLLMDRGIFIATRAAFNVSTAMGEQEIQKVCEALNESLLEMRPYVEKASPDLIAD